MPTEGRAARGALPHESRPLPLTGNRADASRKEHGRIQSRTLYPVRVDASLDPSTSRWLWLVMLLLLIAHYIVLFLLRVGYFLVTVIATS